MRRTLENLLIVAKTDEPKAMDLARKSAHWLRNHGVVCHILENPREGQGIGQGLELDMVLVLGGDGTMLSVARRLADLSLPILGINLGTVGFLTELTVENWAEHMEAVLEYGFEVEERVALDCEVQRADEVLMRGRVINDLTINRGQLARLIEFEIMVAGGLLGRFRADGVIAATPTGSTAYSVSAGGPLLFPRMQAYSLTAICPFLSGFKPLVLPAEVETLITLPPNRTEIFLTLDGQDGLELFEGDTVRISRAAYGLHCASFPDSAYLRKLRTKGLAVDQSKTVCPEQDDQS